MNVRIRQLLNQITALEDELRTALNQQEREIRFEIKGKRVTFERSVEQMHARLKTRLPQWLAQSSPRALLSVPFIYGMAVPLLLMDVSFTLYQLICFPLYRIQRVKRGDYIVIDRHHLGYLNSIEKFNCMFCGYGNGLIAYITEIAARTEQYWCPIKHAHRVLGSHARYARFLEYGDAADYQQKLEQYRAALAKDAAGDPPSS